MKSAMEFISLWKMGKKKISQKRGQEELCHLSPPSILFLPPSLLPYISFGSINFVFPTSPTQKWRNIFWFPHTYSSLHELLIHYGIIKNLISSLQDTCQVSNCRHSSYCSRKAALVKCSSKIRIIQKLCQNCS